MLIEVTGNLLRDKELKEGRFYINPEHISVISANGTHATFHMSNGTVIYSDAVLSEVIKKIESAQRYD